MEVDAAGETALSGHATQASAEMGSADALWYVLGVHAMDSAAEHQYLPDQAERTGAVRRARQAQRPCAAQGGLVQRGHKCRWGVLGGRTQAGTNPRPPP